MTLAVAAALSVLTGFFLLARGGTTLPAALLVIGYVLLVPLALGWRALREPARDGDAPPWRWAALVALAVLVLYRATLAPTTAMWDASEYIAAAKVLGLPHPPGNPLFVLIAHVFGALPIATEFAQRINLLAATASAAAAGLWFLFAYEVTARLFAERWARIASAAACALLGATSFTVWNQSVVNEKVYTVSLLQMTAVVWLLVRWMRRPAGAGTDSLLLLVVYLLALGYTIHPAGYLAAPCVLAAVLMRAPRTLLRGRMVALALGFTALGLTPFAFEVIRSAHHPAINEGEPTACTQGFAIGCTMSLDTIARLKANIAREQYGKPPLSERQAPLGAQLGLWVLYFEWQWLRDPHGTHPAAQVVLALLAVALAVAGARTHAREDRQTFIPFAVLVGTVTVALTLYLNFKYGYSQAPELGNGVAREVRDRDYFYLWSFSAIALWVGLGVAAAWRWVATMIRRERALVRAAPVLLVAFFPLVSNWRTASRAGETFTREWAFDLLDSIAPNGVLITGGDNDTFPLWYAQEVEGHRRDVTVIISTYLGTDWFPRQLLRRGIAVATSAADADSVPPVISLTTPQAFDAGEIHATVPAGLLGRDQLFILRIVRDVLPTHPVYFTSPVLVQSLGLTPYLVAEGMAFRLSASLPVEGGPLVKTSRGMVDVPRSLALWDRPFGGPAAFEGSGDWVDGASLVMPAQYVLVGATLAEALEARGDKARALAMDARVRRLMGVGGLGSIFAPAQ